MATSKELLDTLGGTPKTLEEARAGLDDLHTTYASLQGWLDEAQAAGDVDALMRLRAEAVALPMKIVAATAVVNKFELEGLEAEARAKDTAMVEAAAAVEEYAPIYTAAKAEYEARVNEMRDLREDRRWTNTRLTDKRTSQMNLIAAIRDGKAQVLDALIAGWREGREVAAQMAAGEAARAKKQAYRNPEHEAILARAAEAEARGAEARARGEKLYPDMAPGDHFIRRIGGDQATVSGAVVAVRTARAGKGGVA